MEFLLGVTVLVFGLASLFDKATTFIKQLKSSDSARLSKGFQATVSVAPVQIKSEDCASNTSPPNETER